MLTPALMRCDKRFQNFRRTLKGMSIGRILMKFGQNVPRLSINIKCVRLF